MQRTEVKRKKSKMVLKYFLSYWADCFINDDSDKSNSKKNSIIFINNQDQWPYCQYLNSLMWCIHLKSLSSIFILFLLWYTSIIHGTLELCLLSSFFFLSSIFRSSALVASHRRNHKKFNHHHQNNSLSFLHKKK